MWWMKILLVDDDPEIVDAVSVALHFDWSDCTILVAQNGAAGLRLFFEQSPDLVVLAVLLPGLNGFEVLQGIRRVSTVPVIMLTDKPSEEGHLRGLDLGADDYVLKPFNMLTLLARIRAILRRTDSRPARVEVRVVKFRDLTVDFADHQVRLAGEVVPLTPAEYRLLEHLVRNPNRLIPNLTLCEQVWGANWQATPNDLKALVHRLRRKMRDEPRQPRYIQNQPGMGYCFIAPRQSSDS